MHKQLSISILTFALVVSPALSKDGGNSGGSNADGGGKGGDHGGGKGGGGDGSSGSTGGGGVTGGSGSNASGGVSSGGTATAGSSSGGGSGGSSRGGIGAGSGSIGGLGGSTFGDTAGIPSTTASLPQASEGRGGEVSLPPSLSPVGRVMLNWPEQPRALEPLRSRPGMAPSTVRACRAAIARVARRYGATSVDVASAGPTRSRPTGALMAPIEVRIIYERRKEVEVRQARITCQLDAAGQVSALR